MVLLAVAVLSILLNFLLLLDARKQRKIIKQVRNDNLELARQQSDTTTTKQEIRQDSVQD